MEGATQMKNQKQFSPDHINYIKKNKQTTTFIFISRFAILILLLGVWELFAQTGIIDSFISSSPSRILVTLKDLFYENNLVYHVYITMYETIIGFLIAVILGYLIALILWWSNTLRRILEPYIVVLNSLPKIALGPIIIVCWLLLLETKYL